MASPGSNTSNDSAIYSTHSTVLSSNFAYYIGRLVPHPPLKSPRRYGSDFDMSGLRDVPATPFIATSTFQSRRTSPVNITQTLLQSPPAGMHDSSQAGPSNSQFALDMVRGHASSSERAKIAAKMGNVPWFSSAARVNRLIRTRHHCRLETSQQCSRSR